MVKREKNHFLIYYTDETSDSDQSLNLINFSQLEYQNNNHNYQYLDQGVGHLTFKFEDDPTVTSSTINKTQKLDELLLTGFSLFSLLFSLFFSSFLSFF